MATARKSAKKKARRTVMYSSGGKKLYAVRDKSGKFKDIQQYSRAHAMDIKKGSDAEAKVVANKAAKKVARKTATGRAAVKAATKKVAKRATSAKKAVSQLVGRIRRAVKRATR
jgi:hypothetical protein